MSPGKHFMEVVLVCWHKVHSMFNESTEVQHPRGAMDSLQGFSKPLQKPQLVALSGQ